MLAVTPSNASFASLLSIGSGFAGCRIDRVEFNRTDALANLLLLNFKKKEAETQKSILHIDIHNQRVKRDNGEKRRSFWKVTDYEIRPQIYV